MHDKHSRSRSELWLGRQLRDAARREQPEFSESLHQRIMQAVRPTVSSPLITDTMAAASNSVDPAPAFDRRNAASRRRVYWRSAAWLTAAAAILAMVVAARSPMGRESRVASRPSEPSIEQSVAIQRTPIAKQSVASSVPKRVEGSPVNEKPDEISSAAANYTLDDLSRDAQATAHLLVDQLPFETPAEEWGL